jgi:hypothetical protein
MQRRSIVAVAAIAALVLAVSLFMKPSGRKEAGGSTVTSNTFTDDSLGVRMRLPESSGWSFRREPAAADGRRASVVHADGRATLQLYAAPLPENLGIDDVFTRRQADVAAMFQARSLDQVIARVLKNETQSINGRPYRQWQAITQPVEVPGGKVESICFMWLQTVRANSSIELLGMVRFPAQPTPAEQTATDALVRDVSYVLQSFEVR